MKTKLNIVFLFLGFLFFVRGQNNPAPLNVVKSVGVLSGKMYQGSLDIANPTNQNLYLRVFDENNNLVSQEIITSGTSGTTPFSFSASNTAQYQLWIGFDQGFNNASFSIDNYSLSYSETTVEQVCSTDDSYRYGFNGMEKDDEIKGVGNSYDYGARMYDSRLGRWLSLDKAGSLFPSETPYMFAGNAPIFFIDPNGKWKVRWRDNNEHSRGIVFEAEPGDNLQTLSDQLGIPYQELVDQNFGGNDFTKDKPLAGGEWLRQEDLPGVEVFQNVNDYLASEDIELTNCSNCAMNANGLESVNAWEGDNGEFNSESANSTQAVGQAEEYLVQYFEPVSEGDSKIGDVITYQVKPEFAQEERAWAYNTYGTAIFENGDYSQDYWNLIQEKIDASGIDHFSIVLLKSKDGTSVQTIFEKPGTNPATFSAYKTSDSYNEAPAKDSGGTSVIHTKKNE